MGRFSIWERGYAGHTNVLIYSVTTIGRSYIFKGPQSLPR